MAKDVVIRGIVYEDCPAVDLPIDPQSGGGTARFVDTSDATLNGGSKLPVGESAYANGVKYDGSAPNNDSDDLTVSGGTVTAPAGFYEQAASKEIPNGAVSPPASISGTGATVTPGANKLTLSKQVSVTPNVSTPGYIDQGSAGNSDISLEANVTTKAEETIVPGTSDRELAAGIYLTGKQTIKGDIELKGENIVYGKTIFNIQGTARVPTISQDATTKVLSIS